MELLADDADADTAAVVADAAASCWRQLHMGTEDHIFIIGTKQDS